MASTTETKAKKIKEVAHNFFNSALRLHVSIQCACYLNDKAITGWRNFEDEISIDYPIKGVGISANRRNLNTVDGEEGGFLHDEEPLSATSVTDELHGFPYEAAAATYLFTAFEVFGNDVLEIVTGIELGEADAWHKPVYGRLNLKDNPAIESVKAKLAERFKLSASDFSTLTIARLASLKRRRNSFVHAGTGNISFSDFFAEILGVALALYFAVLPNEIDLKMYPYEDFNEKF
jgi:hypothetical protein